MAAAEIVTIGRYIEAPLLDLVETMIISGIVAVAQNGVIGRKGDLPWHLPDDLKLYRNVVVFSEDLDHHRARPGRINNVEGIGEQVALVPLSELLACQRERGTGEPTGNEVHASAAAHEPQVIDPVAIRFDEDGRMWVVEMRDYPHGPAEGDKPRSRIRATTRACAATWPSSSCAARPRTWSAASSPRPGPRSGAPAASPSRGAAACA